MSPRIHAYLSLLITVAIWGVAAPVIKFTLGEFPPVLFLFYRFVISAAAALVMALAFGFKLPTNRKVLLLTLLYGFLTSTISLGLVFLGFERTTAVNASLISAIGPILVTIAGVLFLREHVTRREKIGIGIAVGGTTLTMLEPLLQGADGSTLTGNMLVFASLLVAVVTTVIAKVLLRDHVEAATATGISFFIGFLTFIPITLLSYDPNEVIGQIKQASLPYHLGVWYMALLSGNLAYFLWHKAQKTIEIGEAALFGYLGPIFAIPLAVLWLKEVINTTFVIGTVIIAIGVFIAERKRSTPERLHGHRLVP